MTPAPAGQEFTAEISIHMPHTWHDAIAPAGPVTAPNFNPHATYVA